MQRNLYLVNLKVKYLNDFVLLVTNNLTGTLKLVEEYRMLSILVLFTLESMEEEWLTYSTE